MSNFVCFTVVSSDGLSFCDCHGGSGGGYTPNLDLNDTNTTFDANYILINFL